MPVSFPAVALHNFLAPDLPEQGGHSRAVHIACFAICLLAGISAWYISVLHYGTSDWSDSLEYIVVGKHLILEGRFPPAPVSYEAFLAAGPSAYDPNILYFYPNLGYILATGLIGLVSGEFTLAGAIILNLIFTLLFAASAYYVAVRLLRSPPLAALFFCLVTQHELISQFTGTPLTEITLFFFIIISVWTMLQGRSLLAGVLLGIAFVFREQALLFFPVFPLLHPDVVSPKTYLRPLLAVALGFIPWVILAKGAGVFFSDGLPFSDFYATQVSNTLHLSPETIARFWKHIRTAFNLTKIPLGFCLYALLRRKLPETALRLVLLAVIQNLIVSFFWSFKGLPVRYLSYSLILLYLAAFLCIQRFDGPVPVFRGMPEAVRGILSRMREKNVLLALIVIFALFSGRKYIVREWSFFSTTERSLASVFHDTRTPQALSEVFPPGSTIAGGMMATFSVKGCIPIQPVGYPLFVENNNERLDGLIVRKTWRKWPDAPQVSDKYGNVFERINPPHAPAPDELLYFKRVKQ